MKTIISVWACLLLAACMSTFAAGGGAIGTDEFLLKTVSPARASIGFFYDFQPLEIENEMGRTANVDFDHMYAVLGYDWLNWVTLRLRAGGVTVSGDRVDDEETGWEIGAGFRARVWLYEIGKVLDDIPGRWSVDVSAEYSSHAVSLEQDDIVWGEMFASVLWNWEFFEHDDDMDDPQSYRFVVSAGAGYSGISGEVQGSGSNQDWDANKRAGFVGGADVFFGRNLAIGGEVRAFDDVQTIGYVTYHF
jgi:hypothetical protein